MSRSTAKRALSCRRLATVLLPLACMLATPPAVAQQTPLPGVGQVEQGYQWLGRLEPTPIAEGQRVVFVARGVVGARADREIGRLLIEGTAGGRLRAGADFRALGTTGVRILLLDTVMFTTVVVHEVPEAGDIDVIVPEDPVTTNPLAAPSATPSARAAEATVPAAVEILLDHFPGGSMGLAGVQASLVHYSFPTTVAGAVVPAPVFDLLLGARVDIVVGGETFTADRIRFIARDELPPPEAPSAILERVEVFADLPALDFIGEVVEPGVLLGGVPVEPAEGFLGVELDPARNAIAAVELGQTGPNRADLVTGQAGGVAVSWDPADLEAGAIGSSAELAAIGLNIRGVEVRGIVTAQRTAAGWDLSFRPPGGLGGPRTVEVDGLPVGEVTVPFPVGVFASAAAPPTGAAVFPIGVGDGAFYGFSWDRPVAITVPGAGTFVGRRVRLVFPAPIGPLAIAGVSAHGLPPLTLTGLAAPAENRGGTCIASATTLCLAGGRFAVEALWSEPAGGSGAAITHPLTADTGAFWFFEAANLELMVKVLDACTVNDRFWVFAGGLTNVEVELTVTDTRTGDERVYRNTQGQPFQPIQDTAAFATCRP